jgi:HD superfamily phosphohydrolase
MTINHQQLDPRKRFDLIKDPVHGYIPFTKDKLHGDDETTEADLINSDWIQRLRRIHQLQSAWIVYPSADHNRLSHALGTMHLAGQFARSMYAPFYNTYRSVPGYELEETEYVVETFRIAGLLHDIGHGPFTHLLDNCFLRPKYEMTHETISEKIIKNDLADIISNIKRSPEGTFNKSIDPDIVANIICTKGEENLEFPWRCLHQIIRGAYDADKMDFLLRDSLMCGQQDYNFFDIERLMHTSLIGPNTSFALHKSSLPLFKHFLRHRIYLFENVYYHRTVRAFELSIKDTLFDSMNKFLSGKELDFDIYKYLDEQTFLSKCLDLINSEDSKEKELGQKWKKVLNERPIWKEIMVYPINSTVQPKDATEVERVLKNKGFTNVKVDMPEIKSPGNIFAQLPNDKVVIYDPNTNDIDADSLMKLMDNIPHKISYYRFYISKDTPKEDYEKIKEAIVTVMGISPLESSY